MAVDLEEILSDALSKIRGSRERDELEARFKALEERKPELRMADVVAALESASDEELEALESTVLGDLVRQAKEAEKEPPPVVAAEGDSAEGEGQPPATTTRPGRKANMVYDWDVDDDGQVVQLNVGRVYSGEDEPDEVEIPAARSEPGEEEEEEAA